jgi:tetratricopeptide (TPR) repeat protein
LRYTIPITLYAWPNHHHYLEVKGVDQQLADQAEYPEIRAKMARLERIANRTCDVIVVEDVSTMRFLLVQTLRQMGFTNIHRAANGSQGLELIEKHKCDLAVVDWYMPQMTGLELLELVREDEGLKDIIFVMVTAESIELNVVRSIEEKIDSYLTKPVNMYQLSRRLDAILYRRGVEALADLYLKNGQSDLALKSLSEASQKAPHTKWPLSRLGKVYASLNLFDKAAECFEKVLSKDPAAAYAYIELGELQEKKGSLDEALGFYRKAFDVNPKFFRAYDVCSRCLIDNEQHSEAIRVLEEAIQNKGTENAWRQETLGGLLFEVQRFMESEEAFRKALELKPHQHQVSNNLSVGKCCFKQGKFDESIEALQRAISRSGPEQTEARLEASLLQGRGYMRRGDPEEAKKIFRRLLDPRRWPAKVLPQAQHLIHREIGKAYLKEGDAYEASIHFKQSALHNLDDQGNIDNMVEFCNHNEYETLGQSLLENINELRTNVLKFSEIGMQLVNNGDYAGAEQAYDKGLELDPTAGRLYYNKAKLVYRLGKKDQCFEHMVKSLKFGLEKLDKELVEEVTYFLYENGKLRGVMVDPENLAKLFPDRHKVRRFLESGGAVLLAIDE